MAVSDEMLRHSQLFALLQQQSTCDRVIKKMKGESSRDNHAEIDGFKADALASWIRPVDGSSAKAGGDDEFL